MLILAPSWGDALVPGDILILVWHSQPLVKIGRIWYNLRIELVCLEGGHYYKMKGSL